MQVLLDHGFTVLGQRVSYAELLGQVFALSVVLLAHRRTLWTWPVQVCSNLLLFWVYVSAHLGGLAARQVVIFLIAVYGWWRWSKRRDPALGLVVRRGTPGERWAFVALFGVGTVAMALVLQALDASWAPWPDAAIFVGTVLAYFAQGLGMVEFWLIWLAVDAVGVPLQLSSGLWFSALVYVVFAVLVVRGWLDWNRTARRTARLRAGTVGTA